MLNLKHLGLELKDLQPADTAFKLSSKPDVELTLEAFHLRHQMWAEEALGEEYMKDVFNPKLHGARTKLAWKLLKQKSVFGEKLDKQFENFVTAIATYEDQKNLFEAVTKCIGISQPVIDKVAKRVEELEGKENPNEPTPQA